MFFKNHAVLLLAALLTTGATAQNITFDTSFESANGASFTQVSPDVYSFTLRPDTNSTDRQWFYFGVNGAQGRTLTFRLLNTNTHNVSSHWNTARPVYSRDGGETWSHMTAATTFASNVYTFSHTFAVDGERVAFHYPYTNTMALARMEEWEQHPHATRTRLGATVQGRDLWHFRVTDPDHSPTAGKMGIWVVCRLHSAEVTASFTMDGFMDYLLGDTEGAIALRQNVDFQIVPMANPDGVVEGNYRNNFAGINLNRVWDGSANLTTSPEVRHIQNAIDQWVANGNAYDLFLDFHSTSGANPHFAFHAAQGISAPNYPTPQTYHTDSRAFLALVNLYAPHFNPTAGTTTSNSQLLAYHRQRIQHGVLSFTFEGAYNRQNFGPNSSQFMTVREHTLVGEAIGKAIVDYYALEPIALLADNQGWIVF